MNRKDNQLEKEIVRKEDPNSKEWRKINLEESRSAWDSPKRSQDYRNNNSQIHPKRKEGCTISAGINKGRCKQHQLIQLGLN